MNIERIFFLNSEVRVDFSTIVQTIATYINDYTVNAKLAMFQVEVALNDKNGLIDGEFHAGGCQFRFQEFNEGNPIIFKITFEGENKRFKIEYETNPSNPDGFISYFVEPDCSSVLHKKIKEFLTNFSKIGGNEEQKKSIAPVIQAQANSNHEINDSEEKEFNEQTSIPNYKKLEKNDPESKVETALAEKYPEYYLSEHMGENCNCPKDDIIYIIGDNYKINQISSRVRKLYFASNIGNVGIYKCEHCGTHLIFEEGNKSYISTIQNKKVKYFLEMKTQLDMVIQDKGVGILRELVGKQ